MNKSHILHNVQRLGSNHLAAGVHLLQQLLYPACIEERSIRHKSWKSRHQHFRFQQLICLIATTWLSASTCPSSSYLQETKCW